MMNILLLQCQKWNEWWCTVRLLFFPFFFKAPWQWAHMSQVQVHASPSTITSEPSPKYVNIQPPAARALVLSTLNYCRFLLNGTKQATKAPKQCCTYHFLTTQIHKHLYTSPAHWLPVRQCTTFKPSVNMHKALSNNIPQYITESLNFNKPDRSSLRSIHNLIIPRTYKRAGDPILLSCCIPMLELSTKSHSQHQFIPDFQV